MTQLETDTRNAPTYLSHYNMHRPPFSTTPENDMYYAEPTRTQRLDLILHLVQYGDELLLVLASEGGGKTSTLDQLVHNAHSSWRLCVITASESTNTNNLVKQLHRRFKIPEGANASDDLNNIKRRLEDFLGANQTVVIIVDDAQKLDWQTLKLLFDLSTITNQRNSASLRVVLFGDPDISNTLLLPELEKQRYYKQRKIELSPIDESQTTNLIQHRLALAGMEDNELFSASVINKIAEFSEGNPGAICEIAHTILLEACPKPKGLLFGLGGKTPYPHMKKLLGALGLIFIIAILSGLLYFQDEINALYTSTPSTKGKWPAKKQISQTLVMPQINDATQRGSGLPESAPPTSPNPLNRTNTDSVAKAPPRDQVESGAVMDQPTVAIVAGDPESSHTDSLPTGMDPPIHANKNIDRAKPVAGPPNKGRLEQTKHHPPTLNIGRTEDWLLEQNPNHYTLQLVAGYQAQTISKFVRRYKLQKSKIAYYLSQNKGKAWHSLVYGAYPSRSSAQKASDNRPTALKKVKPWIRQFKTIQKEIRQDRR